MREIEVEAFLKPMGEGVSRPVLVLGDDFEEYILKNEKIDNNGNIQKFDCMFVNELLAYQLGCYLGVPMPEAVIAYVDSNFINDDPSIRFAYRFENGKYFATQKLSAVENNILENYTQLMRMGKPYIKTSWKNFLKNIKNKSSIATILAFDILIANFDRYDNMGNILVDSSKVRNIYAIDHGHSFFGPIWSNDKINALNLASLTKEYINTYTNVIANQIYNYGDLTGTGIIFKSLEEHINLEDLKSHSFCDVVEKIENISEDMLDGWLNNIPNEWYIDKDLQSAYYKNFILQQKNVVRYIIQDMACKNAFSNYKGGILEWRNQKLKSHTVL